HALFVTDRSATHLFTLSLHDALPISPERMRVVSTTAQLQDEVTLILHQPFEKLPETARAAVQQIRRRDPLLVGRKIVVIDDDIRDRKSTRLNSSHRTISYAVFCLKKK